MISVIIPTMNEPGIGELINRIHSVLKQSRHEIVIVDKSNDDTPSRAKKAGARVIRQKDSGLGSALKTGMISARGDFIITMDADLSHDPIYIKNILKGLKTNDMVIGSRKIPGGKVEGWGVDRKFISSGASVLTRMVLGMPIKDPTSGYRGYRKNIFKKINLKKISSKDYNFQIEILYKIFKNGFKISEIPIKFVNRKIGKSKLGRKEIPAFFRMLVRLSRDHK